MKIKWYEVTWYSWTLAGIIFLVIVPILVFYFLHQFRGIEIESEKIININQVQINDIYGRHIGDGCYIADFCSGSKCAEVGTLFKAPVTCQSGEINNCYKEKTARCEKQTSGNCGWTNTPELELCVENVHQNISDNSKNNCVDCGDVGWQKMDEKCGQAILTKNDFKNCLLNFNWSLVNQNTNLDEIKSGNIEIGSSEIIENQTFKSIKVFIYKQWAGDRDGNLFLLGQLG